MTDTDTLDLCYLKVFLVGPPGVGKTTTLNRLLKIIINICSDEGSSQSTLLANCIQVLVFIANGAAEWLSSKHISEETKLLFGYLSGKITKYHTREIGTGRETTLLSSIIRDIQKHTELDEHKAVTSQLLEATEPDQAHTHASTHTPQPTTMHTQKLIKATHQQNRLGAIKTRLRQLIASGDYTKIAKFLGNTLLNINDIGGQPGFLEMLPALSTGPAMYLVFLDLSKELDKPYQIPFSRDDTVITPYDAVYTVEATIAQILSAIASVHHISQELVEHPTSTVLSEKFKQFWEVSPVATLIGTHKDKLDHPEKEIKQIDEALRKVTKQFKKILVSPPSSSSASFFSVDNYAGTEQSDIGPIREFMNTVFSTHFKRASLPICPKWLIFGVVLRREFKIVQMYDCVEIGRLLEMDKEEIDFCLWYLHCIGTLMHYTCIADDEDDWFRNHVICTPQVVFDSISQLILASLRTLHSKGPCITHEREELIKKGQFSIESIEKYCTDVQVSEKLEKDELLPAKQLIKLLNHVNLLSPITHTEEDGSKRTTYLMPAVLECAPPDELTTPPPPNGNHPEPLHITFACGYVPTGTFCGLITRLVSLGPHGILGLTWYLVEEEVKRNCVSFTVDDVHTITLLCHNRSYEIRVTREDPHISLHDLCAYTLSVILYLLKAVYQNLAPQVAFRCPCSQHTSDARVDSLCVLSHGSHVRFICEGSKKSATLRHQQQVWLGKVSSFV